MDMVEVSDTLHIPHIGFSPTIGWLFLMCSLLTITKSIYYSVVYAAKLGAVKPPTPNYYRSRTVGNPSD